jgi:hypothetical protein
VSLRHKPTKGEFVVNNARERGDRRRRGRTDTPGELSHARSSREVLVIDVGGTHIKVWRPVQADYVVLGGGNVKHLKRLPGRARRGTNANAYRGGMMLWASSPGRRDTASELVAPCRYRLEELTACHLLRGPLAFLSVGAPPAHSYDACMERRYES